MSPTELTVTVKDEERTFKQKFLLYDAYQLLPEDPIIKQCIEETLSNSKIEPDSIDIRATLSVK